MVIRVHKCTDYLNAVQPITIVWRKSKTKKQTKAINDDTSPASSASGSHDCVCGDPGPDYRRSFSARSHGAGWRIVNSWANINSRANIGSWVNDEFDRMDTLRQL